MNLKESLLFQKEVALPCFCSELLPWLGWDFPIPALGSMKDVEHLGKAALWRLIVKERKRLDPSGGIFPQLLAGFSFMMGFVQIF